MPLTNYMCYCSARTYTVKRYFGRKEATFCDHVIQNIIVSSKAIYATGNLLPRRRAIPALSNHTESADLPASRLDKQWNTLYRYIHGMIPGGSYHSNSSVQVLSCVLCVSVGPLCVLLTHKRMRVRYREADNLSTADKGCVTD